MSEDQDKMLLSVEDNDGSVLEIEAELEALREEYRLSEADIRHLNWIYHGETTHFIEGYHVRLLGAGLIRVRKSGFREVTIITPAGRALVERLEGER